MVKRIKMLIPIILVLVCLCISVECKAGVDKYDIVRNPKLIMKKNSKIRLECSKKGKFQWRSNNAKILKVNKKGVVKAKKIGKAKIIATNKKGKKFVCKITVKKKIRKATSKNVIVKIEKIFSNGIKFTFVNNSDEALLVARRYIESIDVNGENLQQNPEDIMANGMLPYIYISPRSKYKGTYSIPTTDMPSGEYRFVCLVRKLGAFPTRELNFTPFATFHF